MATTKTTISDIKHFGLQSSVMAVDKVNAVFTKSFKYIEIFVCSAEYSALAQCINVTRGRKIE